MAEGKRYSMAADKTPLKPTKSVVRKALRDILRPVVNNLVILELFAGTAQVSDELIGEGAEKSFAVDLRSEPEECREEIEWFQRDVEQFMNHGPPEPVGLVFMDPAYDDSYASSLLEKLAGVEWLESQGLVAVETARDTRFKQRIDGRFPLELKRNRRYGGTRLWIYQRVQ